MKRLITTLAAVAALSLAPTPSAHAIPGDGAGPDTPGTSASASPSTLRAGDTLSFRVSGFPAGEVINVKIDDGLFCSQSGVHGACVVHQQRIPASGVVSGSLVLPSDLKPGKHWLRFLASEEMTDANGNYLGVKGFTLRGGANFTIVAGSTDNGSPRSDAPVDTPADTAEARSNAESSTTEDVVSAGTPLVLTLPEGTKKAAQTKKTDAKPETPGAETESAQLTAPVDVPAAEPVTEAATDADDGTPFPWLGAAVLAVAVAGAGLVLRRGLRSRG